MSSKRRIRRNQCGNKSRHESLEGAMIHIKKLHKKDGDKLNPYRCSFCSKFHIGHKFSRLRGVK